MPQRKHTHASTNNSTHEKMLLTTISAPRPFFTPPPVALRSPGTIRRDLRAAYRVGAGVPDAPAEELHERASNVATGIVFSPATEVR